mgnify:CR=1 FL=1
MYDAGRSQRAGPHCYGVVSGWVHGQGHEGIFQKALELIARQEPGCIGKNGTDFTLILAIAVQHDKSSRAGCFKQVSASGAIAEFVEAVVLVVEGDAAAHATVQIALCGAEGEVAEIAGLLRGVWTGYT